MKRVVAHAPGRVNLIGEHTDYNDGFVLPIAIGFETRIEARERQGDLITLRSDRFPNDVRTFRLDALNSDSARNWSDYVRGVLIELVSEGATLRGADLNVTSTLPMGAGLSSSAALLVSTALAMLALAGEQRDGVWIARLAQCAENLHTGARSGIMDQFVSTNAVADCALLLDTRSLAFENLPLSDNAEIVVCNTMVKHELAGSEYNRRREECEAAVAVLESRFGITSLRDTTLEHLEAAKEELGDLLYRRAKHVITENQRVLDAVAALQSNDLPAFGAAMNASHASLQHDYEVSCKELNTMTEIARSCNGVYGSRMTGGGFGGCTVTMIQAGRTQDFADTIRKRYAERIGTVPDVYVVKAVEGATVACCDEAVCE